MSELSMMITITSQANAIHFQRMYERHGATTAFKTFGHGTATSATLNTFGLEKTDKTILHNIISNDRFPAMRRELKRRFLIDVPGTGVVFLVPLSSIGGKRQLQLLLGAQEFQKGEETELKNTDQELIIVIVNEGYSQPVMEAARSARASGGTVIHAKGTGLQDSEIFFGFVLSEEKEMIYIVVPSQNRDHVMRTIMDQCGAKSKAKAICFSLPVTESVGLTLQEEEEAEEP